MLYVIFHIYFILYTINLFNFITCKVHLIMLMENAFCRFLSYFYPALTLILICVTSVAWSASTCQTYMYTVPSICLPGVLCNLPIPLNISPWEEQTCKQPSCPRLKHKYTICAKILNLQARSLRELPCKKDRGACHTLQRLEGSKNATK